MKTKLMLLLATLLVIPAAFGMRTESRRAEAARHYSNQPKLTAVERAERNVKKWHALNRCIQRSNEPQWMKQSVEQSLKRSETRLRKARGFFGGSKGGYFGRRSTRKGPEAPGRKAVQDEGLMDKFRRMFGN